MLQPNNYRFLQNSAKATPLHPSFLLCTSLRSLSDVVVPNSCVFVGNICLLFSCNTMSREHCHHWPKNLCMNWREQVFVDMSLSKPSKLFSIVIVVLSPYRFIQPTKKGSTRIFLPAHVSNTWISLSQPASSSSPASIQRFRWRKKVHPKLCWQASSSSTPIHATGNSCFS